MRKQPGFAASVIVSLGLAIGASAIAFSILDAVRLRALPARGPIRRLHAGDEGVLYLPRSLAVFHT